MATENQQDKSLKKNVETANCRKNKRKRKKELMSFLNLKADNYKHNNTIIVYKFLGFLFWGKVESYLLQLLLLFGLFPLSKNERVLEH